YAFLLSAQRQRRIIPLFEIQYDYGKPLAVIFCFRIVRKIFFKGRKKGRAAKCQTRHCEAPEGPRQSVILLYGDYGFPHQSAAGSE
ncbi:MAG: hypothetical protein II727_09365, partial [Oscillospiraceae bacterium]|nr:hypothetical protein [Oscillospiraceae bacterium]